MSAAPTILSAGRFLSDFWVAVTVANEGVLFVVKGLGHPISARVRPSVVAGSGAAQAPAIQLPFGTSVEVRPLNSNTQAVFVGRSEMDARFGTETRIQLDPTSQPLTFSGGRENREAQTASGGGGGGGNGGGAPPGGGGDGGPPKL